MDTITKSETALQLQFWDASKKCYVPQGETLVGNYRAWRRVLPSKNWALKNPKYHKAPSKQRYSRTVKQVQRDYLLWAQSKGLKRITAYNNRPPPNKSVPPLFTGAIAYITLEQHFAVEVSSC